MLNIDSYNINFSSFGGFISNRVDDISGLLATINRENIRNVVSMASPYVTRELLMGSVIGIASVYCFHKMLERKIDNDEKINTASVKLLLKSTIESYVKQENKKDIDKILSQFVQDNIHALTNLRSKKDYVDVYKLSALSLAVDLVQKFDDKLENVSQVQQQQDGQQVNYDEVVVREQLDDQVQQVQQYQEEVNHDEGAVREQLDDQVQQDQQRPEKVKIDEMMRKVQYYIIAQSFKDALSPKQEEKTEIKHPILCKVISAIPFGLNGLLNDANKTYEAFINSSAVEKFLTFALPIATLCFAWNKDSRTATHLVIGYMLGVNCEFVTEAGSRMIEVVELPFKKICGAGKKEESLEL